MNQIIFLFFVFFTFINSQTPSQEIQQLIKDYPTYHKGMNISSLTLASDVKGDALLRFFHGPKLSLQIGLVAETGSFVIKNSKVNILEFTSKMDVLFGGERMKADGLKYQRSFVIDKTPQWSLFAQEQFWTEPLGWTKNTITTCGGINMLGGYGVLSNGEIQKVFSGIPGHKQIRITANYHFIDAWSGGTYNIVIRKETGFMRLNNGKDNNMQYIWTQKHDFSKGLSAINVCGASYPENKLTQSIDVTIPHSLDNIIISFGSTLDQDPFENSFGISNLQIFIR